MNKGVLMQIQHPPAMPFGPQRGYPIQNGCYTFSGADPFVNQVVLNASLHGTPGSRVFTDVSRAPKQLIPYGRTHVSSLQSVLKESSAYFQGSNDWIEIADSDDLSFISSNFTIEAWIYQLSSSATSVILARNDGSYPSGFEFTLYVNPGQILGFGFYGTSFQGAEAGSAFALNTWHHVAVVRIGSAFTLYRNGIAVASFTSSQSLRNTSARTTIGRDYETLQNGRFFNGFISDVRCTLYPRYAGSFVPPAIPFSAG